jgi:hypothetical protein
MNHKHEDAIQSIHAQSAHIQSRLLQMACRGEVSLGILSELAQHADQIATRCRQIVDDANTLETGFKERELGKTSPYSGPSNSCDARPAPKPKPICTTCGHPEGYCGQCG